jgi:hypothetical protein
MDDTAIPDRLDDLEPLIGRWRMLPTFMPDTDDAPQASTTFEWLPGRRFLIQRWAVDLPDAPDGIAVIGLDAGTGTYVQHYFDSRGVTRVYYMGLTDGVWTLQRIAEPPDLTQRFSGRFSHDGGSIVGRWEISHDGGETWAADFDLTYARVE